MLSKSLGILVIVALLCGTVSFFPQEADADCADTWRRCYNARDLAMTICAIALLEPTPIGELACAAALANAAGLCGYAYLFCGE